MEKEDDEVKSFDRDGLTGFFTAFTNIATPFFYLKGGHGTLGDFTIISAHHLHRTARLVLTSLQKH